MAGSLGSWVGAPVARFFTTISELAPLVVNASSVPLLSTEPKISPPVVSCCTLVPSRFMRNSPAGVERLDAKTIKDDEPFPGPVGSLPPHPERPSESATATRDRTTCVDVITPPCDVLLRCAALSLATEYNIGRWVDRPQCGACPCSRPLRHWLTSASICSCMAPDAGDDRILTQLRNASGDCREPSAERPGRGRRCRVTGSCGASDPGRSRG